MPTLTYNRNEHIDFVQRSFYAVVKKIVIERNRLIRLIKLCPLNYLIPTKEEEYLAGRGYFDFKIRYM